MPLIIDGYNLLHASGILPAGQGPQTLERSRQALLNFLVESLETGELSQSVVVFDARQAPPLAAREKMHRGLSVRFAAPDGDADRMIEELIRRHTSPKRLTVVSSDHRLQNAARRRGAQAVDSDVWFAATVRRRNARSHAPETLPATPPQLTADEVAYWMREFLGADWQAAPLDVFAPPTLPEPEVSDPADTPPPPAKASSADASKAPRTRRRKGRRLRRDSQDKPRPSAADDDIFPPGYADDLFDDA